MYQFKKSKKLIVMMTVVLLYLPPTNISASSKNIRDHRTTNKQDQKKVQSKISSSKKFRKHQNNGANTTKFDEADALFGKRTKIHPTSTIPPGVAIPYPNVGMTEKKNKTNRAAESAVGTSADREASKPSISEIIK